MTHEPSIAATPPAPAPLPPLQPVESETRFRVLAESLPQLVWTCRADGYCEYLSPQWCAYTGRPEAEQLGSAWSDAVHPDDRAGLLERWSGSVATGTPFEVEFRIRRYDGVYRWFTTRALPMRDAAGAIVRWFGSNTDIEDRRRAEDGLRAGERRLAETLDRMTRLQQLTAALGGAATTAEVADVVIGQGAALLGARCTALVLRDPGDPDTLELVRGAGLPDSIVQRYRRFPLDTPAISAAAVRGNTPIFVGDHADGTHGRFSIVASVVEATGFRGWAALPLSIREQATGALVFGFQDPLPVSDDDRAFLAAFAEQCAQAVERARLYEAVQASEARFRRLAEESRRQAGLLEQTADAFIVRQFDGEILYWNEGAAALYGWGRHEVLGLRSHELLHTVFPEPLADMEARLRAQGVWEGELHHRRRDGSVIVVESRWALATFGEGDPVVLETNRDVTTRRERDARLREVQKMEAVGRLAGGVAHEANNQMTVVLGCAEFALRRADVPPAVRAEIEHIRRAADRTAGITRQLLAFGRRQLLRPEALDLSGVVRGLEAILRRTVGAGAELDLQLAGNLESVRADRGQIEQVLVNLVLNARDALPGRGTVIVRTESATLDAIRYAEVPGELIPPGAYTVLAVSDTGTGMAADVLGHLFEPFFTTKPVGQGTGLGLASVHGIVKQSGGFIEVESVLGRGSVFRIYLPADGRRTSVLVVEDEQTVRLLARRALEEAGCQVLEAADGREALDLLGRDGDRVGCVVSDVIMPHLGGVELLRVVEERFPGLPVLLMSGFADAEELVRDGRVAEGVAFLPKPFSPDVLAGRVAGLLARRAGVAGTGS